MSAEHLVRVQGLGLDARFKSMLNVFFMRSCGGEYELTNEVADLLLVDLDALGARDAYIALRQNNSRKPAILFSLGEQEYKTSGNIVLLHKPFTVRQLQSAFEIVNLRFLNRIPRSVRERAAKNEAGEKKVSQGKSISPLARDSVVEGGREDSTFKAAFSLDKHKEYVKLNTLLPGIAQSGASALEYDPKQYLQWALSVALKKARTEQQNAVLKVAGGTLTIDSALGLVKMGMGEFQLREVASFPLNNSNYKLLLGSASRCPVERDGHATIVSLRSLIWKTSLFAGRGRVPVGTDFDEVLRLRRWPNLTRLLLIPGVVRISALWTAQACSINDIVKKLGLSVHDVASFYSAAHALDLFHEDEEEIVAVVEPHAQKTRMDSILGRILSHLRS